MDIQILATKTLPPPTDTPGMPPPTLKPPATNIITPENIHELVQLDYRNENGVSADISISKGILVTSVTFSPNGEILAAGCGINTNDPSVYLYNVATGKQLAQLKTQFGFVHRVAFSPDSKIIAAGGGFEPGMRRGVQIWDVATQAQLLELHDFGDMVFDIAFSPDGAILATAEIGSWFGPGYVKMWSVPTGELLSKFPSDQDPWISAWGVAFHPSGKLVATNYETCNEVIIWDLENPIEYKVLSSSHVHPHQCFGVAFSQDGRFLASTGVYDIATGDRLFELKGSDTRDWKVIPNVTFTPNGQIIASAVYGSVRLWDVNTGNDLVTLLGDISLAFSPDGRLLATGGDAIRLWGVPSH
jgi:WD40 repeat protein